MNLDQELDKTILSFADIQAELNISNAKDALKDIVTNLDLTPEERAGLDSEISGLESMLEKLEKASVYIAVFGMVGRGKSSLLNALLGEKVFETGPIHGVTKTTEIRQWQLGAEKLTEIESSSKNSVTSYRISQVELIDTPGIDEVDGETRELIAQQVAKQADLLLFVVAGDITQVEYEALSNLRDAGKPILLVFNKIDQYPEADRLAIYNKIRDERVRELLSANEVVMAAASPLMAKATRGTDGSLKVEMVRGKPQVEDLKLKVLEILDKEGKSLVALNSMLYADNVNEQLVRRKVEIRSQSANQVIWKGAITKAMAIALNPLTVVDIISGTIIDIAMILTLSKLYGIKMQPSGAIDLLQKIAISMGGISASELVANMGLSSVKGLLGLATPVTGGLSLGPYLSVALSQATVAGLSSYGIGQVTKTYLANGASWGEEGPKAVVTNILASLDETSIMGRIKEELIAKLKIKSFSNDSGGGT
ncbi:MAG: GTP-binding protein [Trichodesmium sp.]